jgi:hypothetical protein
MAPGDPTIIELHVQGLPPAKGQRSIFSLQSNRHRLLITLLEEAYRVTTAQGFSGFGQAPIALDVELRAPAGTLPGDGTNYLGGIADALEAKKVRIRASGPLPHLGDLVHVGLYDNDRQIKQICYREREAEDVSYTIRVRTADSA